MTRRVAIITGASRGIGAATALVLAERGFRVVVNYRSSAEQADEVVQAATAAGSEAVAIQADVTAPDDVTRMVGETEQRWGRVDVLVHNALIPFDIASFADLRWEQLGGKLDRELHAAFLITKAVAPGMISRSYGRLVYLSTGLSRRPREGMITLGTAKAALDQFVRYVALELAPHGITANLVAPATVDETKPMLPTRRAITRMNVSTSPSATGLAGKLSVCAAARRSVWGGACCRG
jgi:NAD(P)-dependent dehydrogenase (short-subunit alcohol dehydrogenase family)